MKSRFDVLAADLGAALGLLTRLPVPGHHDLRASLVWAFPVVGAIVGALAAALWSLALWLGAPPAAAAVLALAAMALSTGGLHEDGLADTADGFSGGRTRERALEIMRDSRIGAHGALTLVLVVALNVASLASLSGYAGSTGLIVAAALSRSWVAAAMAALPPARPDGLARAVGRPAAAPALVALVLGSAAALALLPWGAALAALALSALVAGWLAYAAAQRLGGVTGDILGATQQATQAAILLAIAIQV